MCSTIFLYISVFAGFFARLQRETSRNFQVTRLMKEMSYVFLFTIFLFFLFCFVLFCFFFLLPLNFTLVAASISHFLVVATNFPSCPSNKECLPFLYLSLWFFVALFLVELRWPVACFLSFFLPFSFSIFQICGHDN